jgi:hypothetical protein
MTDGRRTLSRADAGPRIPTTGVHAIRRYGPGLKPRGDLLALALTSAASSGCGGQGSAPANVRLADQDHHDGGTLGPTTSSQIAQTGSNKAPSTTDQEVVTELVGFTSPNGNVGCHIDRTAARCGISERDRMPPPRPKGLRTRLRPRDQPGRPVRHRTSSVPAIPLSLAALPLPKAIRSAGVRCGATAPRRVSLASARRPSTASRSHELYQLF